MAAIAELEPVDLGAGLVLRPGRPDDADAVAELTVAAFGPSDGPAVRAYQADASGGWAVVCDGPRVVSASGRIHHRFRLDGTAFDGAQIEYVVTDPAYRRRRLVRAQFQWHHARAAEAGELALFVGGIPYLYRRFGYGYGLDYADVFLFDPLTIDPPDDVSLRPACRDDLPWLLASETDRPTDGLRVEHTASRWNTWLTIAATSEWEDVLVAERDGHRVGWCRLHRHPHDERCYLLPSMAEDPDVATAMVGRAIDRAGPLLVVGYDHPGTVFGRQLRTLGALIRLDHGVYTRVPDPRALLDALRPVLSARLSTSPYADDSGTLEISLYHDGVALTYERGEVVGVQSVPGDPDPFGHGGVGVAPDWFGALAFGRWGARGLAERVDDVLLGEHRGLMDVLFPRRPSDVVGDF